ncbi:hypothetical protein ES703_113401 [subsurface metagenome]
MADKYANQGFVKVVPTLNVLTFAELATFVSVFEKRAFLISRIAYFFPITAYQEILASTDSVLFGLSSSDKWSEPFLGQASVLDLNHLFAFVSGTPASGELTAQPIVNDFSTLPGGGILVPSRPIFLFMVSAGFTAAYYLEARIYFTVVDLKAEEYWELVEATRLIG